MPWYFYLFEFVSGLFLANGVPHFVQGISGHLSAWCRGVFAAEQHALGIHKFDGRIYSSRGFRASRFCSWVDPGGSGCIASRDLAFHLFRQVALAASQEITSKTARLRSAQSFVKGFSIERLACGEPRATRIISMKARNAAGTWRCPG